MEVFNKKVRKRYEPYRCGRCRQYKKMLQKGGPNDGVCPACAAKADMARIKRAAATRQVLRLDGPANVRHPRIAVMQVIPDTGEIVQRVGQLHHKRRPGWVAEEEAGERG